MPAPRTVLLTGAAGGLGTLMRDLLPAYGYELRLLDLRPDRGRAGRDHRRPRRQGGAARGRAGRRRDHPPRGHLPGSPVREDPPREHRGHLQPLRGRPRGGRRPRSSSPPPTTRWASRPAPGRRRRADALIPIDTPRRPDTFYGLSKSFGEDLAQLYWDKHGLETVSVRIGSCFPEPTSVRMLSVWMSPGRRRPPLPRGPDRRGRRPHRRLRLVRQHPPVVGPVHARALGYEPQDDSEPYAEKLIAEQGELDPDEPRPRPPGRPLLHEPPIWPY